jgi:hypothetical protein
MPGSYGEYGPLAAHVRYVERASRKLARSTFYAMGRWQGELEHKQGFLGRVVDIGAELFAMAAVCVRARSERDSRPEGTELADLFCRQARLRAEALFAGLWDNTDAVDVAAANRVLSGRYEFLEEGVLAPPEQGGWVTDWDARFAEAGSDARRRIPGIGPAASPA